MSLSRGAPSSPNAACCALLVSAASCTGGWLQPRAPSQGHPGQSRGLAQPPPGTADRVGCTPSPGPQGKELLERGVIKIKNHSFPFWLNYLYNAFAQLEIMHPGVITVAGFTAGLRREYGENVGHSTLSSCIQRLCEPLKCVCSGQVGRDHRSVVSDSLRPHDYTVHGILQARILEWVAFPFSRGSSQPRDRTQVSHIAGEFFTS